MKKNYILLLFFSWKSADNLYLATSEGTPSGNHEGTDEDGSETFNQNNRLVNSSSAHPIRIAGSNSG